MFALCSHRSAYTLWRLVWSRFSETVLWKLQRQFYEKNEASDDTAPWEMIDTVFLALR